LQKFRNSLKPEEDDENDESQDSLKEMDNMMKRPIDDSFVENGGPTFKQNSQSGNLYLQIGDGVQPLSYKKV
jgi:hypothetical protein